MKKYMLAAGILISSISMAQNKKTKSSPDNSSNQSQLTAVAATKGQQITATINTTQEMDMGMGMMMNTTSKTVNKLDVLDITPEQIKVSSTLTNIMITGSMMGKDFSFDSEKPDSSQQELAKEFRPMIGKSSKVTFNKGSGEAVVDDVKSIDPESGAAGMMANVIGGNDANIVSGAFMTTLSNKKIGDKWMDSSLIDGLKNINNYTLEAISGDIATVNLAGTVIGNKTQEAMGNSMDIAMNTKLTGKITVNLKNGMVQKKSITSDIGSTVEVMGQTMDMSGKTTTEVEYK